MTTPEQLLSPLFDKLETIVQYVNESPYLSRETRKELESELLVFSEKLKEGKIAFAHAEKELVDLDKKTALQEIESLIKKIGLLNPSSPRLQVLRDLSLRLNHGEISSEQARKGMTNLMNG